MIKARQKPIEEILGFLNPFKSIYLVGCGACVTVCYAGGQKEVSLLSSALRMARKRMARPLEVKEALIPRQCEPEALAELPPALEGVEAVLSIACGVGVQTMARYFPKKPILPGLDTLFMGETVEPGIWVENCIACGNCILDRTGGICPLARCPKQLLNGPCGGSFDGRCEVDREIDCIWHLIYERLKGLGQLSKLEEIIPPKSWGKETAVPRRLIREELR